MDREWYVVVPRDGGEMTLSETDPVGAKHEDRIIYIEAPERPYVCEMKDGELVEIPFK